MADKAPEVDDDKFYVLSGKAVKRLSKRTKVKGVDGGGVKVNEQADGTFTVGLDGEEYLFEIDVAGATAEGYIRFRYAEE